MAAEQPARVQSDHENEERVKKRSHGRNTDMQCDWARRVGINSARYLID